jgi:hypothetical protein
LHPHRLELAFAAAENVGLVGQEDTLHKGTDHREESPVQGRDTSWVVRHMASPDSLELEQEQGHLDPIDLGVAGRNVGDMGHAGETEEDLEDLGDLEDLVVVDLGGEQEQVLVLVEDEIRSEEADSIVSMIYQS